MKPIIDQLKDDCKEAVDIIYELSYILEEHCVDYDEDRINQFIDRASKVVGDECLRIERFKKSGGKNDHS